MICSNMLVHFLESYSLKNQTAQLLKKSFVTAVNHLRGNVVKYLNNSEQIEAIIRVEYVTSQQPKRPRRVATHASLSHLQ